MQLRDFQKQALLKLEKDLHVLVIAPTGSGKTKIIECAMKNRRTLVISPLIALSRQLNARLLGINSQIQVRSPESAVICFSQILEWQPQFIVFDECHTLFEWGDHFRPKIMECFELIKRYCLDHCKVSTLWLSATFDTQMQSRFIKHWVPLKIEKVGDFKFSKNINVKVLKLPWSHRLGATVHFIRLQKTLKKGWGVIFVNTRHIAEVLCLEFEGLGFRACVYHAGLFSEHRKNLEKKIGSGQFEIIIATSAFGMGMDFQELRWTVIWQVSYSLLSLVQASGRAGRGERKGQVLIYWDERDFNFLTNRDEALLLKRFFLFEGCKINWLEAHFNGWPQIKKKTCNRCDLCAMGPG